MSGRAPSENVDNHGARTAGRVLVVDDDAATRDLFSRALARGGYEVVTAADGEAALEILSRDRVDLVLLDNHMPRLGGIELLGRIRERPSLVTLPVILVTGDSGPNHPVTGLDSGADDYLIKPVDLDELLARVRARLRGQAAWQTSLDRLRTRLTVADVIVRAAGGEDVGEIAQRMCGELLSRCGLDGAMIVALPAGNEARILGFGGLLSDPASRARLCHPDIAARLRHHVSQGPSLVGRDSDHVAFDAIPSGLVVALAPIMADARLFGALMLVKFESTDPQGARADALAAAIEFADLAGSLLAGPLAEQTAAAARRGHLDMLLQPGAFAPHFQPIVELATGRTIGFEALTRWKDGSRPDAVLAEARTLGALAEAEITLATAAIRHAHRLPVGASLAINFSASTLLAGPEVAGLLPSDRPVVIEITENERVDDYAALRSALRDLAPNCHVAVDDAGAGYASLRHIMALRPECVKLDIYWISDIDTDPARQALIAGLIHFTNELGCRLLAEGIERTAELDTLKALGVPYGQGYLLGRPAPSPSALLLAAGTA